MVRRIRRVAQSLRRRQTDAEAKLWRKLRGRRLSGWKFRRQHPVAGFVADFACVEASLIVEIDGGGHAVSTARDARRTAILQDNGWHVLRFWNRQIHLDLETVTDAILHELHMIERLQSVSS